MQELKFRLWLLLKLLLLGRVRVPVLETSTGLAACWYRVGEVDKGATKHAVDSEHRALEVLSVERPGPGEGSRGDGEPQYRGGLTVLNLGVVVVTSLVTVLALFEYTM